MKTFFFMHRRIWHFSTLGLILILIGCTIILSQKYSCLQNTYDLNQQQMDSKLYFLLNGVLDDTNFEEMTPSEKMTTLLNDAATLRCACTISSLCSCKKLFDSSNYPLSSTLSQLANDLTSMAQGNIEIPKELLHTYCKSISKLALKLNQYSSNPAEAKEAADKLGKLVLENPIS